MSYFKQDDVILFQGDSVTDCGRTASPSPAESLGNGYPLLLAGALLAQYPEKNLTFINRGVSGNRVVDLEARWQADTIDIKPTVLSILIGINDCWRRYDRNDETPVEAFAAGYRRILERAGQAFPALRLILLEPFVLPVPEDRKLWRVDLDPKIDAVRTLAREFGAAYVPLDGLFAAAGTKVPPSYWAADGVHPTTAGAGLIASAWLRAIGE